MKKSREKVFYKGEELERNGFVREGSIEINEYALQKAIDRNDKDIEVVEKVLSNHKVLITK